MEGQPPPNPNPKGDGVLIEVSSMDQDAEESKLPQYPPGPNPEKGGKKKDDKESSESAEDRELQEKLDLAVERLQDPNMEVRRLALELLRKEIRESTRWVPSFLFPPPLLFFFWKEPQHTSPPPPPPPAACPTSFTAPTLPTPTP
jgi:hypothetical protein